MFDKLPSWLLFLLAILFGWLVMPRVAAYTGLKV